VTYAEKIGPEDRHLDPKLTADLLERRVRALRPHIGTYVELPWDERLGVTRASLATGGGPGPGELAASDGRLLYGAANGPLELCEVHPAGKRPMDAEAWIRGYGERLNG
jgi:methionyl-tRNA formyltransferase